MNDYKREVDNLKNLVADRNKQMSEWANKKRQATLRLDMWNASWNEFFD